MTHGSTNAPVMPIAPDMLAKIMPMRDLNKPQWDAALIAAKHLTRGNVHNADDRAAFRAAKAALVSILPADTDASRLIQDAVRWSALNDLAGAFAGFDTTQDNMGGIA